nr:uncharacterized protein LOC128673583 [Plodia interpunctella]
MPLKRFKTGCVDTILLFGVLTLIVHVSIEIWQRYANNKLGRARRHQSKDPATTMASSEAAIRTARLHVFEHTGQGLRLYKLKEVPLMSYVYTDSFDAIQKDSNQKAIEQ